MIKAPQVPIPGGRVHPLVLSRVASEDDNFTGNFVSANTRISPAAILVIAAAIALFFLLLVMMG